jgi:hypothetical protein
MLWGGLRPIGSRLLCDVASIGLYLSGTWLTIDDRATRNAHLIVILGSFFFTILR